MREKIPFMVEVVFVTGTQAEALDVDLLFDHVLRLIFWIIKLDYGDFYANFNSLYRFGDRQIGRKTKFKYQLIRINLFFIPGPGLTWALPFLFIHFYIFTFDFHPHFTLTPFPMSFIAFTLP
jgi:hypothetical protein